MKIGRLKKDKKWNYGIAFEAYFAKYKTKSIRLWFFKVLEFSNPGAPHRIKGFDGCWYFGWDISFWQGFNKNI